MTEFVQMMQNWRRMCAEMHKLQPFTPCYGCRLEEYGCPVVHGVNNNFVDFDNVEKVVKAWTTEHPEPQYPTWEEWLITQGVIKENQAGGVGYPMPKLFESIPADIAEKLEIKPKEE